jgi:hypothetical protein
MTLPPVLEKVLDSFDDDENERPQTDGDDSGLLLPPPSEPMAVARIFLNECLHDDILTLRYWRGGWWMWKRTHWVEVHDGAVRSILYRFPVGTSAPFILRLGEYQKVSADFTQSCRKLDRPL